MKPLNPGDKIESRYRILHQLGSGGFSRTYLAEDLNRFKERCVLKEFAPQMDKASTLAKAQEMFEREAGTLYRLSHEQIPKFRQLLHHSNTEEGCLFLVQDYIEGATYHKLLNQRLKKGQQFNETEIKRLLLQVLPILSYIHNEGIIHRDISPENLIYNKQKQQPMLIDFGCIKEVASKAQSALLGTNENDALPIVGTAIGKANYAPPEQIMKGIIYPHTDLYALAATAVVLLTGKKPQELRNSVDSQWKWQSLVEINPQLNKVLNTMLAPKPSDRFSSAAEVIEALQAKEEENHLTSAQSSDEPKELSKPQKPSKQKTFLPKYFPLIIPLLLIAFLTRFVFNKTINNSGISLQTTNGKTLNLSKTQFANKFSQGEKVLIPKFVSNEKEKGTVAYGKGNYSKAASLFAATLKSRENDPEALIYFNNALIGSAETYDIAVVVPIGTNLNSAKEVLRGVAQAQNQINQTGGINNTPLKIHIVDDQNQPELAQEIAATLSQNSQILGVVGHYKSEVTLAAASTYQDNELVAISPISSAVKLSSLNPYIFRTVPSDYIAARALAKYMIENQQQQKVAIFYSSQSEHSESLKLEFKSAVTLAGGSVVNIFDLAEPNFSPNDTFQQALDAGAEAIMLSTNPSKLDKALQVIQVNQQRLSLYGGDDVYTAKTLQIAGEAAQGMVLEIPWHIKNNSDSSFAQASTQLWGADVSWRTAMAYDATKALIAAIADKPKPTRASVQEALVNRNFAAQGADELVKFSPAGDRLGGIQLVKIQPSNNSNFAYEFIPINP